MGKERKDVSGQDGTNGDSGQLKAFKAENMHKTALTPKKPSTLEKEATQETDSEPVGVATKVNEFDALLFETPLGGIMTKEVGTISGPVELFIKNDAVRIRYEGALDIYTVSGTRNGRSLQEIAKILTIDPGIDEYGNPKYTHLRSSDSDESTDEYSDDFTVDSYDDSELATHRCTACDNYVYNPALGDPERDVIPGTAFEEIPEDWKCPNCNATKDKFAIT